MSRRAHLSILLGGKLDLTHLPTSEETTCSVCRVPRNTQPSKMERPHSTRPHLDSALVRGEGEGGKREGEGGREGVEGGRERWREGGR